MIDCETLVQDVMQVVSEPEPFLQEYIITCVNRFNRWRHRQRSYIKSYEAALIGGQKFLVDIQQSYTQNTLIFDERFAKLLSGIVFDLLPVSFDKKTKVIEIVKNEFLVHSRVPFVASVARKRKNSFDLNKLR